MFDYNFVRMIFSFLAVVLAVSAYYPYIKSILRSATKPHLYSWLIWLLTQVINFFITAFEGIGGFALVSFGASILLTFVIFILSFKFGTKDITLGDKSLLTLVMVSILIWYLLKIPLPTILIISLIDAIGYLPTLRKTLVDPTSEKLSFWIISNMVNVLTILVVFKFNAVTITDTIVFVIGNSLVCLVILLRTRILQTAVDRRSMNAR